jgi:hypothetical protein
LSEFETIMRIAGTPPPPSRASIRHAAGWAVPAARPRHRVGREVQGVDLRLGQVVPARHVALFAGLGEARRRFDQLLLPSPRQHGAQVLARLVRGAAGVRPFVGNRTLVDPESVPKGGVSSKKPKEKWPDIGLLEQTLKPAQEENIVQRDDPLPAGSTLRFGTSRFRHGIAVSTMAVSADGRLAVAVNGNHSPAGATRVFDLVSGRALYTLGGPEGRYIRPFRK